MMLIRTYIFLVLMTVMNGLAAQDFYTKVSAKTIGTLDAVEVNYVAVGAEISDFAIPDFSDWRIISGPKVQTKSEPGGGLISQQVVYVLQPKQTGNLLVPGAKATIRKLPMQSKPVQVLVKDVDHIGSYQPSTNLPPTSLPSILETPGDENMQAHILKKGENVLDKINNNLIVKLQVTKNACYVGEAIMATYKLGTRLRSESRVIKQPVFNGCTVIEMTTSEQGSQRELIDGKPYNVFLLRRVQLFPLQAGPLLMPEAIVENDISFYDASSISSRDMYYGNLPVEKHKVNVKNPEQTIEVKPLPAFQPANNEIFSGAVGNFDLEIYVENEQPETNATNKLVFVIKGEGNLQMTKTPGIAWPKGFEAFEPVQKMEEDKTYFPVMARKTFSFPFVVSQAGEYTIPPVSFTYFEPNEGKYITKFSLPLTLKIVAASNTNSIENLIEENNKKDFNSRLLIILGALILAGIIGVVWYKESRGQQKSRDKETTKENNINKSIAEPDTSEFLYRIRSLHPDKDNSMFYKLLCKSIHGFIEAKYGVKANEVLENPVRFIANGHMAMQVKELLHNCNMGMYTPVFETEEAMQHRLTAIEVLTKLERS